MPLGRAHRLLRLRRIAEAEADLERARELDPYGFNTAYLDAFARYLQGRYDEAVAVYRRALAASEEDEAKLQARGGDPRHVGFLRTDPATRAAFTAWYYRALRRAGRDDEAAALLETVDVEAPPGEPGPERFSGTLIRPDSNEHYFRTLLFYRGVRSEEEVLDRDELGAQWTTVAYGVAWWHLLEGARGRALSLYREFAAAPHWARLGHVAAEADLKRL
jgi:tetratricopeptide (TPR) repeat protein